MSLRQPASFVLAMLVAGATLLGQSAKSPIEVARELKAGRLAEFTYGSISNEKKTTNCVGFVFEVLEELRKDQELSFPNGFRAQVMISNLSKDEASKLDELVENGDARLEGVKKAIVDAGFGKSIEPKDALPGDFVQYWYQTKKGWRGHAGIIESIKGGVATIYGCHLSTLASERSLPEKERKGGIGPGPQFDLRDDSRKVFVVRWNPSQRLR